MNLFCKLLELQKSKQLNIAVVGDMMVDEYYDVKVERISPEAPILVLNSEDYFNHRIDEGGALKVAQQFKNFNVFCSTYGIIENSPIKKRFFNNGQPLFRWDIEKPNYGLTPQELAKKTLLQIESYKEHNPDVTIFSDYAKGVFTQDTIRLWMKNCIGPSIVDPKRGPINAWQGCDIFKPNAKEAYVLSERNHWKDQLDVLAGETQAKMVVITMGGDGVVAKIGNKYFDYKSKKKVKVSSVIGAGDCFAAFLAMSVGVGFSYEEAVEIAYEAGAIYVQNNRPLHRLDMKDKYVSAEDFQNRDFSLVFTNGCFDAGLTRAHVEMMNFAKQQGDRLVVAINSDASVSRLKGVKRPILPLQDRMAIVAALESVDYVISFDEDTPWDLLKQIQPDVLVKGGDYTIEQIVGSNLVNTTIFPYVDCLSTTGKLDKLAEISA